MMKNSYSSIQAMAAFYTRFPYPDRPLWVRPRIEGMLQAHAGFARLLVTQPCSVLLDSLTSGSPKPLYSPWKMCLSELDRHFSNGNIALVGCGTDEPLLFAMLHRACQIDAFDVSLKSIKIAKRKILINKHLLRTQDIHFFEGDATQKLELSNKTYDFIQCFGVLHHQTHPILMISAMAKKLKAGGMLRLMVYTKSGRRIERWFQRKILNSDGNLRLAAFIKLYLWIFWVQLLKIKPWYKRFSYLNLSPKRIADALAHPSDPGLSFRELCKLLQDSGFSILQIEHKHWEKGWQRVFRPNASDLSQLSVDEESGHIISNILFFAQKMDSR